MSCKYCKKDERKRISKKWKELTTEEKYKIIKFEVEMSKLKGEKITKIEMYKYLMSKDFSYIIEYINGEILRFSVNLF